MKSFPSSEKITFVWRVNVLLTFLEAEDVAFCFAEVVPKLLSVWLKLGEISFSVCSPFSLITSLVVLSHFGFLVLFFPIAGDLVVTAFGVEFKTFAGDFVGVRLGVDAKLGSVVWNCVGFIEYFDIVLLIL